MFKRSSLRQFVTPVPITHIQQVDHVKLLWVFFTPHVKLLGIFFTPTLTTSTHINSVIAVMNQRLYLLKQLRKQGLDIRGLTQIFMGQVVARLHYALPAIAGQISMNDLHIIINAVFAKAFRWQLISIVSSAADIVDNADKKTVSLCPQLHPLLTPYASTPKKCSR